jgi:hypothetical protein
MRSVLRLLILVIAAFAAVASALARGAEARGSAVYFNDAVILSLKTYSVDGSSPEARAETIASTLNSLSYLGEVKIRKVDKTHVLFAGGERIVTITPEEAKAQKSTPAALAQLWSGRLRTAFVSPPLKVAESSLRLPCPSNKIVAVKGFQFADATISSSKSEVVTPIRVPGGIKLAANKPGNAIITIQGETTTESIEVSVQPYAAILPQTFSTQVSGSPALASTIRGAIEGAITTQLQRVPGSVIRILSLSEQSIGLGTSKSFTAKIRVAAQDAFENEGEVSVIVRNIGIAPSKESALWYCNDPENVNTAGPLFSANLKQSEPVRLLYHHQNTASFPLFIRIQAVNDSDLPARVLILPGDSDPDKNPVRAGLKAGLQYMKAWTAGSGDVVTIPPRSTMPISLRRMNNMETVSGLCSLRLIDGPETVLVRTDAWPPFNLDRRWATAIESTTPWREVGCNPINDYDQAPYQLSDHIYPDPYKQLKVQYRFGENWKFFKIGEKPISGSDNQRVLSGNFGVVYNITGEIINPTSEPIEIELVFEASAGYSGALFLVNGVLKESPLLQPKAEYRIEKFRLLGNDVKRFELMTIPLSGSSYPAQLTIRPLQSLSTGVLGGK